MNMLAALGFGTRVICAFGTTLAARIVVPELVFLDASLALEPLVRIGVLNHNAVGAP